MRIVKMNEEMIKLFEVKRERDSLLEERQQLVEAKQKYHTRSSELKERVLTLQVRKAGVLVITLAFVKGLISRVKARAGPRAGVRARAGTRARAGLGLG